MSDVQPPAGHSDIFALESTALGNVRALRVLT